MAGQDGAARSGASWWAVGAALVCLAGPAGPALAQQVDAQELSTASSSKKDVDIEADRMEVLNDQKKAIFTGRVDAKREDVTLNAEKLVVDYVETPQQDGTKKTEVTFLEATGGVVIVTARQRITGDWAKMDVKADRLTVGGEVTVVQGKTVLKGKQLSIDLKTKHSELTGGRVKGSFVPGQ
jgi:lipopolysaccharide export system protein LptA